MSDAATTAYQRALELARKDPLGAFISVSEGEAVGAAPNGSLAGVPYAVKDNIDTVALPTTANTPALLGSLRTVDNPVVAKLRAAGALCVGKTNLHELAFGITTNAAAHPATRNPFDLSRSPGGSSGGSGAAVGSGMVPFALATDTGGSATIPAAWCGVYGYRPSMGRWPMGGVVPLSLTRDTVGVIASSLDLLRRVDEAVRDRGSAVASCDAIRVGVPKPGSRYLNPLAEDVREVWGAALEKLSTAERVEVVEVETDRLIELDTKCGMGIVLYETARDLSEYLRTLPHPLTFEEVIEQAAAEDVRELLSMAYEMREDHEVYTELMRVREELCEAWDRLFAETGIDAMLHPTTPFSATPIGEDLTTRAFGDEVPTFATAVRNTGPGASAGQPVVTIPAGIGPAGLPVGISVEGGRDRDDDLLAVAACVDEMIGVRSPLLGSV